MKKQILILQSGVLIPLLLLLGSCSKSDAAIEGEIPTSEAKQESIVIGPPSCSVTYSPNDNVLKTGRIYNFTAHNIPDKTDNSEPLQYTGWVTMTSQVNVLSYSGNVMTCMFPAPGRVSISYSPYVNLPLQVLQNEIKIEQLEVSQIRYPGVNTFQALNSNNTSISSSVRFTVIPRTSGIVAGVDYELTGGHGEYIEYTFYKKGDYIMKVEVQALPNIYTEYLFTVDVTASKYKPIDPIDPDKPIKPIDPNKPIFL